MKSFLILTVLIAACEPIESHKSHLKAPDASFAVPHEETSVTEARLPKYEVHFSPKGGCTGAIVALIHSAKTEILVQAYSFTSKPIEEELIARAPIVKVILDRSDIGTPGLQVLLDGKISEVLVDEKHAIAHNKVIVIDKKVVETGSFNYTGQAETSNAENCLIVRDADLAQSYATNWRLHEAHSIPADQSVAGKKPGFRE